MEANSRDHPTTGIIHADPRLERKSVAWRPFWLSLFTGLLVVVLAAALDLTGTWTVEATFDDNRVSGGPFDCVLVQEGGRLTGACAQGAAPLTGEVRDQQTSWTMQGGGTPPTGGAKDTITYIGIVNETGTRIEGRFTMAGKGGRFIALKSLGQARGRDSVKVLSAFSF